MSDLFQPIRFRKLIIKALTLLLLLVLNNLSYSQTNKAKALEKGEKAIALEDKGKYADALKLFAEAQKLDPENINYPYEIAFSYYLQKDYKTSLQKAREVVKLKNATDQCFQMLGNIYDEMGDSINAIKAYDEGLKVFPKSGKLFLEKGNLYWGKKEYGTALPLYEQGIEADPKFSSNYYRAARIYCSSSERVWGMIYGEIFMNLERNTKRTAEISELLYDTYISGIKISSDSTANVSFCKNIISIDKLSDFKKGNMPFCMVYEPSLLLAAAFEKHIDITSLDRIRKGFVESYFEKGFNKTHPNVLFDYQNKILKSGNLEAYNHWILMKGDEDGFSQWQTANKKKWETFVKWFGDNPILIDANHRFYSSQY